MRRRPLRRERPTELGRREVDGAFGFGRFGKELLVRPVLGKGFGEEVVGHGGIL